MKAKLGFIIFLACLLSTGLFAQDNTQFGISYGYTNQQFKFFIGDFNETNDGIWFDRQRLHGFSFGLNLHSYWKQGYSDDYSLGIFWGCYMELYHSKNKSSLSYNAQSYDEAYDDYTELDFQMPLHFSIQYLIDEDYIAIGAHVGPGMTVAALGEFSDSRKYYDSFNILKDELKAFNLTFDFALSLLLYPLRIDVQWDRGLLNVMDFDFYDKGIRNKFSVKAAWVF